MIICPKCEEKDSIVSVEESVSQFRISVVDGQIDYDGTSEKQVYAEVVDYQCVQCLASFSYSQVLEMEVKE